LKSSFTKINTYKVVKSGINSAAPIDPSPVKLLIDRSKLVRFGKLLVGNVPSK
jgi:hypothetical protein